MYNFVDPVLQTWAGSRDPTQAVQLGQQSSRREGINLGCGVHFEFVDQGSMVQLSLVFRAGSLEPNDL